MEQIRQIGEALGSLNAIMEFRGNIQINQRQCNLLLDISASVYTAIIEAIKKNLRFEDRYVKWKVLAQPLQEVHRIIKECEGYIKQCLETKDWWAKAIFLHKNADCVELHIHNLLTCIPTVIEAIETASWEHADVQKNFAYMDKYRHEWKDSELFRWMFANQYLITQEFCDRIETVSQEDRWMLLHKIKNKITITSKQEHRLAELLQYSTEEKQKLFPSSTLLGALDYHVKRRLGSGSQYKEITWLGDNWALRHFFGDIESQIPEISSLLSLSHPNILQTLCGFIDDEKRECFLVSELMSKDLRSYIREVCGPRKRTLPFSLPVAVDLMLQIARGMEYLHFNKIHHGSLSPSSILVKGRSPYGEGYLLAKVFSFGFKPARSFNPRSPSCESPFIWYAPEVLEEQEQAGSNGAGMLGEKADVYSFGMVCFEILTGKVPFGDSHLQGDKMSKNIRAGERPLFPPNPPKLVSNFTKRCWHANPRARPSFSSICRILRYTKRFLVMNPDVDPATHLVDYSALDMKLSAKYPEWDCPSLVRIPFEILTYRVAEGYSAGRDVSDSGSDKASMSEDETSAAAEDTFPSPGERKSLPSPEHSVRKSLQSKKWQDARAPVKLGAPNGSSKPPQLSNGRRAFRVGSESQLLSSPRIKRMASGNASDSELL